MYIGVLQFTIEIPYAESLKDKRRVVKSMKDKLRRLYNVSIAETEDQDELRVATLGVAAASSDVKQVNSLLDRLLNTLQDWRDASLTDHQLEIFTSH
jgi:uncharacterized protein YlxP (DUF503 family)